MTPPYHRYIRKAVVALALVALAAWLLPSFVGAERYRRRLEAGLERALKRPVTFGAVAFHLLPRPGFSIANAMVREDPAFGSEPFARVERIDCELRWRSLWRSRIDFARLYLDRPTFNVVRNAGGEWNVERLLLDSGIASPPTVEGGRTQTAGSLELEADAARINFKVGEDKKPFAITDLGARVNFDHARGLLRYRLTGSPVRTDLSLPSPGTLELEGTWTPGRRLDGPVDVDGLHAGDGHHPAQAQRLGDQLAGLAHEADLASRFQFRSAGTGVPMHSRLPYFFRAISIA